MVSHSILLNAGLPQWRGSRRERRKHWDSIELLGTSPLFGGPFDAGGGRGVKGGLEGLRVAQESSPSPSSNLECGPRQESTTRAGQHTRFQTRNAKPREVK